MAHGSETLAAIDVGTNSFHLIVVKLLPRQKFSVITKEKCVVRLGESPSQIKKLSDEAMDRGVEAMKLFRQVAAMTGSPVRAVATSAVREAENGEDFIERVRRETDIEIEVVSGFEEARLIYLGVLQALSVYRERIALFDIGGGSTEFFVGDHGRTLYANSFKIGALRLTQRFFPDEEITKRQVEACRLFMRGEIYHAAQAIRNSNARRLIGSSGTAQTVASMILAMNGEEIPESLNTMVVRQADVRRVLDRVLAARTHAERAALPGVDPRRADILAAGCLQIDTIMSETGFAEYTISSYALREGIVLDTLQKRAPADGTAHLTNLRYETVHKIGRMYRYDEAHALHVTRLALMIYDDLAELHGFGDEARELLEAASLLHDIGYYISHSAHHKHALYLIQNGEMLGFNNEEIAVIANVARYHRKSHPKRSHPEFAALRREDQQIVRVLAAILRVADGLDRTHKQCVQSVECSVNGRTIALTPACPDLGSATFEVWSANRKKQLMEEVFGRVVAIEWGEPAETKREE